jgi:transposase
MRRRYELSTDQYRRLEPLLPHPTHHGGKGRPWLPHFRLLNGILWVLHSGAPWRDVPERYGPWQTVYDRFTRWRRDGTWAKLLTRLLDHLDHHGRLGHRLWCVDGTIIRASRAAGGARHHPSSPIRLVGRKGVQVLEPPDHALGYSRGGFGTKVHLLVETHGIIVGIYLTPGQRHESKAFKPLMDHPLLRRQRGRPFWPEQLAGDRGYSYPGLRGWLKRHHIRAVIPTRKNQPQEAHFAKKTYRKRNIIERVNGWYKECRRLGTRYEKLAVNMLAFWFVAMIDKLLHLGRKPAKNHLSDSA